MRLVGLQTFCLDNGRELGANQEAPKDSYTSLRETIKVTVIVVCLSSCVVSVCASGARRLCSASLRAVACRVPLTTWLGRYCSQARETGADQTGYYGKKANPLKRFMEATLGNPSAVQIRGVKDGKGKFLENDRAVLRFFGIWDDRTNVYGAKLRFNVHYFLADDTVSDLRWSGV